MVQCTRFPAYPQEMHYSPSLLMKRSLRLHIGPYHAPLPSPFHKNMLGKVSIKSIFFLPPPACPLSARGRLQSINLHQPSMKHEPRTMNRAKRRTPTTADNCNERRRELDMVDGSWLSFASCCIETSIKCLPWTSRQ